MHKEPEIVTSAQARDLSYGGLDLRPNADPSRNGRARGRGMPARDVGGTAEPVPLEAEASCELAMIPGPESVKAARDFTAATLRGWDLEALVDAAVIVASELVTNAIRHGKCLAAPGPDGGQVELTWERHEGRVVCLVTDCSNLPPVLEDADPCSESGRGLQVVQAVAAAWGWFMLGARAKAVWAAFLLP